MLPRFLLSKLLRWNIIAFHFIFKNCCQGSLLASWSQHKSENTLLQGKIFFFKLGFEKWFPPDDEQVKVPQIMVTRLHFRPRDSWSSSACSFHSRLCWNTMSRKNPPRKSLSEIARSPVRFPGTCVFPQSSFPALRACLVLSVTSTLCDPWTVAHQAPLSMVFSRWEYCSG